MGLETGTTIADLNENWPEGTDNVSQGDDHLRLIKSVLKSQFPNLDCAVLATCDDLNKTIDLAAGSVNGQTSKNATQNLPWPASEVTLTWQVVDWDTDTQFSGTTFTCKHDGIYACVVSPYVTGFYDIIQNDFYANVTSTDYPGKFTLERFRANSGGAANNQFNATINLRLRATDTVTISQRTYTGTTGGTPNLDCIAGSYWQMVKVGDLPAAP